MSTPPGGPLAHFPTASDDYLRQVLKGSPPGSPAYETAKAILEDRKADRHAAAAEKQAQAAANQVGAAADLSTWTRRLVRAWELVNFRRAVGGGRDALSCHVRLWSTRQAYPPRVCISRWGSALRVPICTRGLLASSPSRSSAP